MAVRQGKFDIRSRPGKSDALPKVRDNPQHQATSEKRWWRLAQAGIDDTIPIDRARAAKDAIKDWQASKTKPSRKK